MTGFEVRSDGTSWFHYQKGNKYLKVEEFLKWGYKCHQNWGSKKYVHNSQNLPLGGSSRGQKKITVK
jgi:hypothetical protein